MTLLFYIISIFFIFVIVFVLYNFYKINIDYYGQILKNANIPDYTRWILSDKYVAKEYAKKFGFKISKTYEIKKYPQKITYSSDSYVIKPLDLCDSAGVYLIKNGINIKTGKEINKNEIINELLSLRSNIYNEYYMHDNMYNGLVPFSGYIKEELLLDNDKIPHDYKCYIFGGKLYYIAVTFNRKTINGIQTFNSVWFDHNWKPIKIKMIKNGYVYKKIKKPDCFDNLIKLVENMGQQLKRHCRIDIYIIKNEIYFGEFTFFCGANLHTFLCNLNLGYLWIKNKDDYDFEDKNIKALVPNYYNKP